MKNKKIHVFFLFLLMAFIILMLTKLSKNYTNTISFNVEKINVPQENVILNDSLTLKITLKTNGFKWLTYYFSKPKITIDFKNEVDKNDSVFTWKKPKAYIENTQFDNHVDLLNINPESLTFHYGVNMVKKVPVKLHADIIYSIGFNASKAVVLNPDSVVVVGPDILVSNIKFISTKFVKLKEVKSDIFETVKLKLPEKNANLKLSNTEIQLKISVEKFTEGTLNVPVDIINIPPGIVLKYFPKSVNVSYYVSLSNYSNVVSKDFKVICDYNKVVNNQSLLVPELQQFPSNVKNVKINQQRIEFIIIQ